MFAAFNGLKCTCLYYMYYIITKIKFQDHEDVISVVQAGFIGVWGEWYYTTHFGNPNNGGPNDHDWANRIKVVNALLTAVPIR